jgi:hypothetical protein
MFLSVRYMYCMYCTLQKSTQSKVVGALRAPTNKLFKQPNDFAQFLTSPSSDHRPPTKIADPPMETSFQPLRA